ncbi:MAG TPA: tetratricopeptide repeat protein [Pirellulales bacterium]|nr:tetratricopeptide repeat protein [Pirellulales bacterium]
MIDDEREVDDLITAMNEHLPMRAYATAPLAEALRPQGAGIKTDDPVKIDSVLYLGDEGGVACSIGLSGGKTAVVTSITHLRIDGDHPLAGRIRAYQLRRSQSLQRPVSRGSRKSRASVAAKPKPKRKRPPVARSEALRKLVARFQTACKFWESGDYQRAADAFSEVLDLEPGDPCFARYWLASCLFQLGPSDELQKLLRVRDDHSGVWRFAQALLAFRRYGDTEEVQRLLVEANRLEPGFEHYLLRDKVVDARREVRFDADHAERAFGCARLFLPAWRAVPGAAAWARRTLKVPPTGAEEDDPPRRFPRNELRGLPLRRETWQVGLVPCPGEPRGEDAPMWLFGVVNIGGQEIRAMTVIDRPLTETFVWNQLVEAFLSPLDGAAARPSRLVVCRREFRDAWAPLLSEIGTRCRYENGPQPVGRLLEAMGHEIERQELPPADDLDIREFPQSDAVWQADFVRSPAWVMNEQDGLYRPWTVLVLDKLRSIALTTSHTPGDPTPEVMLEFLVRTMARPGGEPAERPRLVELSDSDCYDHLRPRLDAAGIGCRLVDELSEFNDFCLGLARSFDRSDMCALADGQGVTRAQMESFYEAAAYYFRQAPWSRLPGELPIEIRCDGPPMGTRVAIALGRTGVQLGLCVYDDWEITRAILGGYATADENRALAVCYDEAQIMSAVDLYLIDRLGWPIATPEAWPAVMRLQPGHAPRSAGAEELVFLDACLRAIPDFIGANVASRTLQVETGTRRVELRLAWDGCPNKRA